MAEKTKISWASDTWNFWIGCAIYAAECLHCYAMMLDQKRFSKTLGDATKENPISHWGNGAPRHRTSLATALAPLRWNKHPFVCGTCGHQASPLAKVTDDQFPCSAPNCTGYYKRRMVFTGSLMDWADEEVPDQWRDELFDIADRCPELIFLFLTKRGENACRYITARYGQQPPANFWFGQSWMKDRPEDVKWLLMTPCHGHRWLSVEPMLGPADLLCLNPSTIDWVIFGGESETPGGPAARPCDIEWIRDGILQCRECGAVPFVKQLGSNPVGPFYQPIDSCEQMKRFDCAKMKLEGHFKDKAGADMSEWPEDVQVQEYPK